VNSIIHSYILKGIQGFRYVVINAIPFQLRKMVNSAPFRGMLLRDYAYRVTLEIREGRREEGASYPSQLNVLS